MSESDQGKIQVEIAKDVAPLLIADLSRKIDHLVADPTIRASIQADAQTLLSDLSKIEDADEPEKIFAAFLDRLEQKPETDGIYRLTFEAQDILGQTRTAIADISESEDGAAIRETYEAHLGTRALEKSTSPTSGEIAAKLLEHILSKLDPRQLKNIN